MYMYNMYIVNAFYNVSHIVQSFFERGNKSATLAALGGMPWIEWAPSGYCIRGTGFKNHVTIH